MAGYDYSEAWEITHEENKKYTSQIRVLIVVGLFMQGAESCLQN